MRFEGAGITNEVDAQHKEAKEDDTQDPVPDGCDFPKSDQLLRTNQQQSVLRMSTQHNMKPDSRQMRGKRT